MAAEHGRTWGESETEKLLELWSEEGIQVQLQGSVRNEVPFRKLQMRLKRQDTHVHTYVQCREKIKDLKMKYKEVVDRLRRSGIGRKSDDEVTVYDFKWFHEVHRILKNRAVINPPHVLDSAAYNLMEASMPSTSRALTEGVQVAAPCNDPEVKECPDFSNSPSDHSVVTKNFAETSSNTP